MDKSPDAFRTISEVAQDLSLPQHVLRFWETRFTQIKPLKRGGGRRYYRPDDVELLRSIRRLLYADGYTIKGVQRLLREHGAKAVAAAAAGAAAAYDIPSAAQSVVDEGRVEDGPTVSVEAAGARPDTGLEALFGTPPGPRERSADECGMSAPDRIRLRALLAELSECERLLTAARNL